jgi:hypothetical protein
MRHRIMIAATEPKEIVFNRKSLDGLQVQTLGRVGTISETVGKVARLGSRLFLSRLFFVF